MRKIKTYIIKITSALWLKAPRGVRKIIFKILIKMEGNAKKMDDLNVLCWAWHEMERQVGSTAAAIENGVHPKAGILRYEEFFIERIKEGNVVLDVGCGQGRVSFEVAKRCGAKVWGIDNDPQKIEEAKARYKTKGLEFFCIDAFDEMPVGRSDVIILSNILEHIEERIELLRKLTKRLNPSKVLIRLPLFDRHWMIAFEKNMGFKYVSDDTHVIELKKDGWLRELREAGLIIINKETRWGELWCECEPDRPE